MNVKSVYVETTNICNLNCKTCYNRSGLNKEKREISKDQLEKIIQLFLPFGLSRFLISGGEPVLHSEFEKILDLIDEYPNLSFGIVTNGTNHNCKLIEYLNTRPNFTLQVSLDGSNEEQNSKTRGGGNFEKALAFAKKINNTSTNPLLKMVISQNNYDDIENFYKLALSINFTPEFAFIFKSGNGANAWEDKTVSPQQKLKALNLIDALNKKHNAQALLPFCTGKCPFTKGTDNLSLCVKSDGSIQPCQMLYQEKYTLGNVFSFDPDSFYSRLDSIVAIAQKRYRSDYGCEKCMLNGYCGRGCMGAAANLNDDPYTSDGDCEFRKLQLIAHQMRSVLKQNAKEDIVQ